MKKSVDEMIAQFTPEQWHKMIMDETDEINKSYKEYLRENNYKEYNVSFNANFSGTVAAESPEDAAEKAKNQMDYFNCRFTSPFRVMDIECETEFLI